MEKKSLYENYQELQRYVGWTDADASRLASVRELVLPSVHVLIDELYDEISQHPGAAPAVNGGPAQVERLKAFLHRWVDELFCGEYGSDYVCRRWQVGWRNVEINLALVCTNLAICKLRVGIIDALEERWEGSVRDLIEVIHSLNRLLDLDVALIEDAYSTEYVRRRERMERLAAIGKVSGGIAHELRNPLNVVKSSVFYLSSAKNLSPSKVTEHLTRIADQVEKADGVISALCDFAALPLREFESVDLGGLLRELINDGNFVPKNVQVSIEVPKGLPPAKGDRRQLGIVFSNLIRNACDAMDGDGQLSIVGQRHGGGVEVSVRDNGVGIKREDITRIMEPLYTTKARGIGLGLSLTNSILEKHGGRLCVESEAGRGSTFKVQLSAYDGAKP